MLSVLKPSSSSPPPHEMVAELKSILNHGAIRSLYQPIVDLHTQDVVAYEALARGPIDSPLERPDQLFATARSEGLVERLDWLCRSKALEGALEARLHSPLSLFVNVEPETAGSKMPIDHAGLWATARMVFLRVVFELTERAVLGNPAGLLADVHNLRSFGWGIALDDVGQDPKSLAVLPYIQPDVIKLDMRAVREPESDEVIQLVLAVNAEAERSSAVILAEGIETEEQREIAIGFGAHLGQGWLFGKPAALPRSMVKAGSGVPLKSGIDSMQSAATPFEVLARELPSRIAGRAHLLGVSRLLERRAASLPHPPMVLGAFQRGSRLAGETATVYAELAEKLPFVVALGVAMEHEPLPGVRGVSLSPDDPLANEWTVVSVSPYSAAILSAREVFSKVGNPARSFEVITSFDRNLVVLAAATLLARIVAQSQTGHEEEADFVAAIGEAISQARSKEELARPILKIMSESLGLESTFLSQVTEQTHYDVLVSHNSGELSVEEGLRLPWSESVCKAALEDGRGLYDDVQIALPAAKADDYGFRTFVTVPVASEDGKVLGTLCGASSKPGVLSPEDLQTVRSLARLIASYVDA